MPYVCIPYGTNDWPKEDEKKKKNWSECEVISANFAHCAHLPFLMIFWHFDWFTSVAKLSTRRPGILFRYENDRIELVWRAEAMKIFLFTFRPQISKSHFTHTIFRTKYFSTLLNHFNVMFPIWSTQIEPLMCIEHDNLSDELIALTAVYSFHSKWNYNFMNSRSHFISISTVVLRSHNTIFFYITISWHIRNDCCIAHVWRCSTILVLTLHEKLDFTISDVWLFAVWVVNLFGRLFVCWLHSVYRAHLIIFGPHGFKSLKALGPMHGSYWITQA